MAMTSKERVMCALAGGQPDRIPFVESNISANIAREVAGVNHNLKEWEISDLFGRDVVIPILYPPYFADQIRLYEDDTNTYIKKANLRTRADLDLMVFPDPNDLALYADAKETLAHKGDYACGAAIKQGVASTLVSMGMDNFAYALADDPWFIHEVLRRYVDWQLVVTQNLIAMGFDFLWCFDDVAYRSGPLVSPAAFRKFLLPAFQRHAEAITIPWIFHSDGNIMSIIDDILSLGPTAIHPIEPGPMDLAEVKEKLGKKVCLIGNVSVDRLSQGTPEEIDEIVKNCIKTAGPGGGYMVTSSNSVPRYAKAENVVAMANAVKKYGDYPLQIK